MQQTLIEKPKNTSDNYSRITVTYTSKSKSAINTTFNKSD